MPSAARKLHASRRVYRWTDTHDGAYRVDVRLHPEAGARFDAALRAKIDELFKEARRAGRREPYAAYAADALVALVCGGPSRPVDVKLTVDHAAIMRGHTEPGETCTIDGIGTVPVSVARSLLDDALISVLVRDGTEIITVTSPKRTIPAALRRVLEARYPECGVHRLQQRPVPADRPHRADRARRSDEPREHVAHLHALSRSQDVSRLGGRRLRERAHTGASSSAGRRRHDGS